MVGRDCSPAEEFRGLLQQCIRDLECHTATSADIEEALGQHEYDCLVGRCEDLDAAQDMVDTVERVSPPAWCALFADTAAYAPRMRCFPEGPVWFIAAMSAAGDCVEVVRTVRSSLPRELKVNVRLPIMKWFGDELATALVVTNKTGLCTYLNKNARTLFGIGSDTKEYYINQLLEAGHGLDHGTLTDVFPSCSFIQHRVVLRAPDGTRNPMLASTMVLRSTRGSSVSVLYMFLASGARAFFPLRTSDYKAAFDLLPVSLWYEDFSELWEYFNVLRAQGVTSLREHFVENPGALEKCVSLVRIVDVNQATVELLGVEDRTSLLGSLSTLYTRDSAAMLTDEFEAIWVGSRKFEVTTRIPVQAGGFKDVVLRLRVLPDHRRPMDRVVVSLFDITEQQRIVDALRARAQEMEDFASAMAHDLKNMLQSIMGYAELAKEAFDPRYMDEIVSLARETDRILTQSRELAQAGLVIGEVSEVDLDSITRSIAQAVVPPEVSYEQGPLPVVRCHRETIIRVIQNLLVNAVEHTHPSWIRVYAEQEGNVVSIVFQNEGPPLSSRVRKRLFEPGFTTKAGGGRGLSIVRRVVEAHDWKVSVDPADFPTFRVSIPKRDIVRMKGEHSKRGTSR